MISEKQTKKRNDLPMITLTAAQDASCCVPVELQAPSPERLHEVASQVKLLGALADNTRLGIVEMLARLEEPLCVCDITSQFDLGQPTISHHLKVLRDAGLVHWERRGLWVYYSLNRETLARATSSLQKLLTTSEHGLVLTP